VNDVVVVIDQIAYRHFVSWAGPIGQHVKSRSRLLKARAVNMVGVYDLPPVVFQQTPVPGLLKESIRIKYNPDTSAHLEAEIGSDVKYGLYHHEPTAPHKITPRNPFTTPHLVFWWGEVDEVVFRKAVFHPGDPGNPYLTGYNNAHLREFVA
jgi:hypothetical protein